jgi:hypothetical protein
MLNPPWSMGGVLQWNYIRPAFLLLDDGDFDVEVAKHGDVSHESIPVLGRRGASNVKIAEKEAIDSRASVNPANHSD